MSTMSEPELVGRDRGCLNGNLEVHISHFNDTAILGCGADFPVDIAIGISPKDVGVSGIQVTNASRLK